MADADWGALKIRYVTGNISYRQLAEENGLKPAAVETRGKREKWAEERRKYRQRAQARALKRAENADVKRLAKLQRAGTMMCDRLEGLMRDAEQQLYTHVAVVGTGDGCSEITAERMEVVDDRKLLNITKSIHEMSRAMRNLYDIQTAGEKAQLELAREEMALKQREQERRERETEKKQEDKAVSEIEVIYGGIAEAADAMEAYHD